MKKITIKIDMLGQNYISTFMAGREEYKEIINFLIDKVNKAKEERVKIQDLCLSVRTTTCLRLANIHYLEDLAENSENDMLKYKNFGRKSLVEMRSVLEKHGLSFKGEY